jgi:hypothetical protein
MEKLLKKGHLGIVAQFNVIQAFEMLGCKETMRREIGATT